MAATKTKANRMSSKQYFELGNIVRQWISEGNKCFESWESAERYFARAAGFEATKSNIRHVCKMLEEPAVKIVMSTMTGPMGVIHNKINEQAKLIEELTKRVEELESRPLLRTELQNGTRTASPAGSR